MRTNQLTQFEKLNSEEYQVDLLEAKKMGQFPFLYKLVWDF